MQIQRLMNSQKRFYLILFIMILFLFPCCAPTLSFGLPHNFSAPIILDSSLIPTKVQPGDIMTVSITVMDFFGIKTVQANFSHELGFDLLNLKLVSGTIYRGVWQGQWIVHDTKVKEYETVLTVLSRSGFSSSVNLSWYDPPWYINWKYRKLITLNHSQVPNNLTSFPVVINITDDDLKNKAQSDGDDILFTDSNGDKLNHEIEEYDSATGKLIAWVKVPSLSSSSDTEIFMYYGNSTCGDQQNISSVWIDHSMVYHFKEPIGTSGPNSVFDSTGKTSGTPSAGIVFGQSGKIGNAPDFSSGTGIDCGILGPSLLTAETAISFWIYSNNVGSPSRQNPFNQAWGGWGTMTLETNGRLSWLFGSNGGDGTPSTTYQTSTNTVTASSWIYITAVRNPNGYTYSWYKNGDYLASSTYSSTYPVITYRAFTIGSGYRNRLNGTLDEFRVSTIAHSNSWIKTSYNNQNNATNGGFFIVGEEEIAVPTKPTLSLPGNNTALNNTRPTFQWENCENHENYTLYVSNTYDFLYEHINISLSPYTNSYVTPVEKEFSEGKWYWKVVANNSQKSNSSDIWSFIIDTTRPNQVNLSSPANRSVSDSNSVTFLWNSTNDSTINTSEVSNIKCYQLQVANNSNFSSPLVNENTSNNATFSLTKTVTGKLYWRVCAWDNAGNQGNWSETWNLTIFSYSLSADSYIIQLQRGTTGSTILRVTHNFGVVENVSLSYQWNGDNQPNSVNVSFSNQEELVPFNSTINFISGESSSTGTFICTINATSESGINRSINIEITVYTMLFSLDVFPRSLSLIRSDQGTATVSVNFDQGSLSSVSLSGGWVDNSPSGVSVEFNPSSGMPNFDSVITFTTSNLATAGSFVYRVTGTSSGLSKIANIYVDISKNMSITVTTDKQVYKKGQNILISGIAKDPKGNLINNGTVNITISFGNWSYSFTSSIVNGLYNADYYITFDKTVGEWTISITGVDGRGHTSLVPVTVNVYVESPDLFEQYSIDVISPIIGQVLRRGDIVTFSIMLANSDAEQVTGAEVRAVLPSSESLLFSEGIPGAYSKSYKLGYDFPIGNIRLYVEGKKYDGDKLRAGFNFIDFEVTSVSLLMKLIELKPGDVVEVGEVISLKIELLYPNGEPVENSVISMFGPSGTEVVFSKSKSEPGVYIGSYVAKTDDLGEWAMFVRGEDAFGNIFSSGMIRVEIVSTRIGSYLARYWWVTLFCCLFFIGSVCFIVNKKVGRLRLHAVKNELSKLYKLKEKNAVFYYSDFSINRETYDRLSQEYESKIASLLKKQRILEMKYGKK